ncbi:MAG: TetR/AcrR family transcriptional regulator [Actinobacteria bacterium]|nr:TetR/AcrR family transcriptional regulator [Actinomycetota bacterium]
MNKEQRKIKSRNKILSTAEKYFTEKGIKETDIDEICREAGLTRGAFYHHFPTKQQFLLELLDRWANKMASQLSSIQFELKNSVEILTEITEKMQPVFEQAGKQLPIFLELYIKAVNDPSLKKYVLKSYCSYLTFLTDVVSKGAEKDSVKKTDIEDISKILFSITIGLLIQGLINPQGTDWGKLAKKSIRLLLG